jgi:hypothetical protein
VWTSQVPRRSLIPCAHRPHPPEHVRSGAADPARRRFDDCATGPARRLALREGARRIEAPTLHRCSECGRWSLQFRSGHIPRLMIGDLQVEEESGGVRFVRAVAPAARLRSMDFRDEPLHPDMRWRTLARASSGTNSISSYVPTTNGKRRLRTRTGHIHPRSRIAGWVPSECRQPDATRSTQKSEQEHTSLRMRSTSVLSSWALGVSRFSRRRAGIFLIFRHLVFPLDWWIPNGTIQTRGD